MIFLTTVYLIDALIVTRDDPFREIVSALLVYVASPLCVGNICYWDRQLPVISKFPYVIRIIVRLIVASVIFLAGAQMYVGVVKR